MCSTERHGEESDLALDHLVAQGGAIVFDQRIGEALAVAEEQDHVLPRRIVALKHIEQLWPALS